jgi:predicted CoA-substrate-specific enzyme activase
MKNNFYIGLDIGSTTAKIVLLNGCGDVIYSDYTRHNANIFKTVALFLERANNLIGNHRVSLSVTGSVGMGISERLSLPFVQEVIAATNYAKEKKTWISTIIDIGGEDAKVVYFGENGNCDLRMNGNCAGGTGAFIDQMALILGEEICDMDNLATEAKHIYPIASRCGVFSKTDVQNLISNNIPKTDIAASIFHAVAVQTVVTLSHGYEITPPVLLVGGPLSYIKSLRKALANYLKLCDEDFVVPENGYLIPAFGAALRCDSENLLYLDDLIKELSNGKFYKPRITNEQALFESVADHKKWTEHKNDYQIKKADITSCTESIYLGIDSGSTTTKIVAIDETDSLLFSYYCHNEGNPIDAANKGLIALNNEFKDRGANPIILGSCSTGYGERLIKTAFRLNHGIIETIAHFLAAKKINPEVSFILDIGGQDMKAIFIENQIITRIEINEACSSGCGTFMETFANTLGFSVQEFSILATKSKLPSDLGTRCTVFMNSKVKQELREGAPIEDIAAGLSFSVIKNCLYKVLKLTETSELGNVIVVQGGAMKNDSLVRAFELLIGKEVFKCDIPELMGAYGCALFAKNYGKNISTIENLIDSSIYSTKNIRCRGCENNCYINSYIFNDNIVHYSGNKCEKVFSDNFDKIEKGINIFDIKNKLLFDRSNLATGKITIGIPRCLNMFEEYPFWHALFKEAGIKVILSDPSTFSKYESGLHTVMSDNICFPAKLVHSHIYNLIEKGVDRIFLPFVIFEMKRDEKTVNSYNCPIVTGYSEVIKSSINPAIPVDSPVISFKERNIATKQCVKYLGKLGVGSRIARNAVESAFKSISDYDVAISEANLNIFNDKNDKITILLAGRPYHADQLVQHKASEMIAEMGINVITEDIVRNNYSVKADNTYMVTQWSFINRILKAANWVASKGKNVHFIQLTSFGCGPDAFLLDEVRSILKRSGKVLTILKVDDINNLGSMKLRVRSVVESLKFQEQIHFDIKPFKTTNAFNKNDISRKILVPYFTDYISPLLPSLFKIAGYDLEVLPESDKYSAEEGLIYANNEVCYPATLVVGDIIKALKSGRYKMTETAVAITQTGGQCRATNYISLIKKAMITAGFGEVPVVAVAMGNGLINEQPGFNINWIKVLPSVFAAITFGDCISKFYHASIVRESKKGDASRLKSKYLNIAERMIARNKIENIYDLIGIAANDFNSITVDIKQPPKVGIVGEIFLKFNSFAHSHVVKWLINEGIEVVPPQLLNFFTQYFVNRKVNEADNQNKNIFSDLLSDSIYKLISNKIKKINQLASRFKYYTPIVDIFNEAVNAKEILSLSAQFGEGWLLPGEIVSFSHNGINNVISLQPFGCIANHIISKGVEKKIKSLYPNMNILSLDFDGGVSQVNITNRLLLFINNIVSNKNRPIGELTLHGREYQQIDDCPHNISGAFPD